MLPQPPCITCKCIFSAFAALCEVTRWSKLRDVAGRQHTLEFGVVQSTCPVKDTSILTPTTSPRPVVGQQLALKNHISCRRRQCLVAVKKRRTVAWCLILFALSRSCLQSKGHKQLARGTDQARQTYTGNLALEKEREREKFCAESEFLDMKEKATKGNARLQSLPENPTASSRNKSEVDKVLDTTVQTIDTTTASNALGFSMSCPAASYNRSSTPYQFLKIPSAMSRSYT
eukprot:1431950-Amphidinium_carterae.4